MANTHKLITAITVGAGGASTIDFTSIPSTYTDIVIYLSTRVSDSSIGADINIKFNNTDTLKTIRYLQGNGTSAASGTYNYTSATAAGALSTSNTFASSAIYIPSYANTSNNKSFSIDRGAENNATETYAAILGGLWASTAAIDRLTFVGNFVQYTSAYLYGISKS